MKARFKTLLICVGLLSGSSLVSHPIFSYSPVKIYGQEGIRLLSRAATYHPDYELHLSLTDEQNILLLSNQEQKKTIKFHVVRQAIRLGEAINKLLWIIN